MQKLKLLTFDSAVCQTAIQTEEDVTAYRNKGHFVSLTEAQFKELYPEVDPKCIFYAMYHCIYFNRETMVACAFIDADSVKKAEAAKNYQSSVFAFPDTMRFNYLALLAKKGIPDLYKLYFDIYTIIDYGFSNIDDETFQIVVNSKTAKDRAKTRRKLKKLPDVVTIFRGENNLSTPYNKAYSWSLDIGVATFFALRAGVTSGRIVVAEIDKENIIEVVSVSREEKEVIVDPTKVRFIEEMDLGFLDEGKSRWAKT